MLAALHDARGCIAIPGFYTHVRNFGPVTRAAIRRAGPPDRSILGDGELRADGGERGYSLYERIALRPALTISVVVGARGPGGKAIIPARDVAKINIRLAADQDPREIEALFRRHVARITLRAAQAVVPLFHALVPL